ncbi:MAG: DNA gyrase inhibitor YacG [Betaproteobacteria bacterium]|nr:DNA gyrase inhibitor YacG [Betaproteobacteria bacterium]
MAGPAEADRHVACPGCGHPSLYSPANRFRPFCSERCRLIDLGQWATESYRIPTESISSKDQPDSKG